MGTECAMHSPCVAAWDHTWLLPDLQLAPFGVPLRPPFQLLPLTWWRRRGGHGGPRRRRRRRRRWRGGRAQGRRWGWRPGQCGGTLVGIRGGHLWEGPKVIWKL